MPLDGSSFHQPPSGHVPRSGDGYVMLAFAVVFSLACWAALGLFVWWLL